MAARHMRDDGTDSDRREWWESNRRYQQRPKSGTQGWCGCDRIIISHGHKCPLCHRREGRGRKRRICK